MTFMRASVYQDALYAIDKTLNDVVPPLIPRDPLNSDVLKAGFNFIRPAIPTNEGMQVEIDPTSNAPIAVFGGTA